MGIFNSSAVSTASLLPVIIPSRGNGNSSSDAYRMMNYQNRMQSSENRQNASDNKWMDNLTNLEGASKVLIEQSNAYDMLTRSLREQAMAKALDPNTTELQSQQLLEDFSKQRSLIESKKQNLQIYAQTTKDDRVQWEEKWKEMGNEGTLDTPALMGDFGSLTSDASKTSDGRTVRTYNLFFKAKEGLVDVNPDGYIKSQGNYMLDKAKSTAIDSDGSPVRFRPPVASATSEDYMTAVKANMKVSGSTTSDNIQFIHDGQMISITKTDADEAVNQGLGYVKTTSTNNMGQLKAAANASFEMLNPLQKNAALQRLILSGSVSQDIHYGKDKKIPGSSYGNIAYQLQSVSRAWNMETDDTKRKVLEAQGIALSQTLINGTKDQVYRDAVQEIMPQWRPSSSTSIVQADAKRKEYAALTVAQSTFNSGFLEAKIPLSDATSPDMFMTSKDGISVLTKVKDARIGTLPTGFYSDAYFSLLFSKRIKEVKGFTKDQYTFKDMLVGNMILGGDVVRKGQGYDNLIFNGVDPDNGIMLGHNIKDGVYDLKSPAKTVYLAASWTVPENELKNIKIPQFNRYGVRDPDGSTAGKDTTFSTVGYKVGSYTEPLKHVVGTENNPQQLIINPDGTGTLKGWIKYDPSVTANAQASISNVLAAKGIELDYEKQNVTTDLKNKYGVPIDVKVTELDNQKYADRNKLPNALPTVGGWSFVDGKWKFL